MVKINLRKHMIDELMASMTSVTAYAITNKNVQHVHSMLKSYSMLKSFLFCKSSLPQPFLFLLQDSLYGFPILFTVTSKHIRLFTFYVFLHIFSCRFRAVD